MDDLALQAVTSNTLLFVKAATSGVRRVRRQESRDSFSAQDSSPLSNRALGIILLTSIFLSATQVCAADKDCRGYDALKNKPVVDGGRVTGGDQKTFFVKGETDDKACPAGTAACQRKAFLVPGNIVLVSSRTGSFACVTFVNGKGIETTGWMPTAALTMDAPASISPTRDWTGTWVRDEAKITIKAGSGGALAIHGDATFGLHDPQRVRNGSVNVGEVSGSVAATGNRLGFTMGDDDRTLPIDSGDDSLCRVWMQRAGDYLLVDDNNGCGGMNVSFRGTYVRP